MIDSKSIVSQVEENQKLMYELHSGGCEINEHFQVGARIEKLPTSWNDFKIYLKHKRPEMNMEDLILRLRVEEDHRKADHPHPDGFVAIKAMQIMLSEKTLRPSLGRIRFRNPCSLHNLPFLCLYYLCKPFVHQLQNLLGHYHKLILITIIQCTH